MEWRETGRTPAGICLSRSATLLTRNRRRFEKVPDLRLGELWSRAER